MTLSLQTPMVDEKRPLLLRRIAAYSIDTALFMGIIQAAQRGLFVVTDGFPFNQLAETNNGWLIYAWMLLTVSLPIWLYFVLSERSPRQATLGKRLLGLQVVAENGAKGSVGQLISRTVLKLLPWEIFHLTMLLPIPAYNDPSGAFRPGFIFGMVVLGLYFLMMLRTPRLQSIHDVIAKTLVVKK